MTPHHYNLTFVDGIHTKRVEHVADTWDAVVQLLSKPTVTDNRDAVGFPLFVPAELKTLADGAVTQNYFLDDGTPAYSRCDANLIQLDFLTLDIDNDPSTNRPYCSIAEALQQLNGLTFFLYTSFNHRNPEKHGGVEKFRVLLPLAKPAQKQDIKDRIETLKALFPSADHAGFTASQPFYRPMHRPELPFDYHTGTGEHFDLFQVPVNERRAPTPVIGSTSGAKLAVDFPEIRTEKFGSLPADELFELMFEGYQHRLTCYRLGDIADRKAGCFVMKLPDALLYYGNDGEKTLIRITKAELPKLKRTTASSETDPLIQKLRARAKTQPKPTLIFPDASNVIELNERYLPPDLHLAYPKRGVVCIRSPKGSGKTERLGDLVRSNRASHRSTLLIGHRVHLLRNLSERTGLDNYQDQDDGSLSNYSAVCLNSLAARRPAFDHYDTIIIDESEQVLQSLIGDHLKNVRNEVFIAFHNYIKHARLIICLDADLTASLTIRVLQLLRGDSPADEAIGVINAYPIGKGRTTRQYLDKYHLLRDATLDVAKGEKVFYACNSIKHATTVGRIFEGLGKNVLVVTSATGEQPHVKAFIENPAVEAIKYDCLVTSPTLSTGVSIDAHPLTGEHHFTRVYGSFALDPGTFLDIDQSLSRVRDERVAHNVWVQGNDPKGTARAKTVEEIYDTHIERHRTASLALPGTAVALSREQLMWAELTATLEARYSEWSIFKPQQLRALRATLGWTWEEVKPSKDASNQGKGAYQEHKGVSDEHAHLVVAAETIGAEEYDRLLKVKQKSQAERLSMERYRYTLELAKIGREFNLENVARAIQENLIGSLRFARTHIQHDTERRTFDDKEDRKKNTVTFTDNKHRVKQNELLLYLCKSAQLDFADLHRRALVEEVEITPETLAKVAAAYATRQRDCNLFFGSRIKEPTMPDNHAKVWKATIGSRTLPLTVKRIQKDGVKQRRYFINAEAALLTLEVINSGHAY